MYKKLSAVAGYILCSNISLLAMDNNTNQEKTDSFQSGKTPLPPQNQKNILQKETDDLLEKNQSDFFFKKYSGLKEINNKLIQKLSEKTVEIKSLKGLEEYQTGELEKLDEQIESLEEQNEKLKKSEELLSIENKKLKESEELMLIKYHKEKSRFEQTIKNVKSHVTKNVKSQVTKKDTEIKNLIEQIETQEQQLIQESQKKEEAITERKKGELLIQELKQQIEHLKQEHQKEVTHLKNNNLNLTQKTPNNNELEKKNKNLLEQNETLVKKNKNIGEENKNIQSNNKHLKKKIEEKDQIAIDQQKQSETLKEKIKNFEGKIKELEEKNKKMGQYNKDILLKNQKLNNEMEILKKTILKYTYSNNTEKSDQESAPRIEMQKQEPEKESDLNLAPQDLKNDLSEGKIKNTEEQNKNPISKNKITVKRKGKTRSFLKQQDLSEILQPKEEDTQNIELNNTDLQKKIQKLQSQLKQEKQRNQTVLQNQIKDNDRLRISFDLMRKENDRLISMRQEDLSIIENLKSQLESVDVYHQQVLNNFNQLQGKYDELYQENHGNFDEEKKN